MSSPDLERLRFLLDGLRESAPDEESERWALQTFGRLWVAADSRGERTGQDRRKRERRRRAVLVETDPQ